MRGVRVIFHDGEAGKVVTDIDAGCEVVIGVFDEDWSCSCDGEGGDG
jgi:hypothetical protein